MRWNRLPGALPTIGVALACTAVMGGGVFLSPSEKALGEPFSEGPLHLWSLWAATQGLWEHGPFVRVADLAWPEGYRVHLMDPINLVVFAPVYALAGGGAAGATLAWNALHAIAVLVGAYGCWRLGSYLAAGHPGQPAATALLTLVFCAGPFLLQTPEFGRTEYLPAVLWPCHLALLLAWMRVPAGRAPGWALEPAPAPRWTIGMAAGLVLGAMALGGWYIAVFAAFLQVPLGLWLGAHLARREALARLAFVAVLSLICVIPAALALAQAPPPHGDVFSADWAPTEISHRTFRVVAITELFRLEPRRVFTVWLDQVPYTGVAALLLGIAGLFLGRRSALPWLVLALYGLMLSLGPLTLPTWVEGRNLEGVSFLRTPLYGLMRLVPPLAEIHNWSRIAVLVSLPTGLAAMEGLLALWSRWPHRGRLIAAGAAVAIAADHATYPTLLSLSRGSFDVRAPDSLLAAAELLPPGPLITLPRGRTVAARDTQIAFAVKHMLWQLQHHRPISSSGSGDSYWPLHGNPFGDAMELREKVVTDAGHELPLLDGYSLVCAQAGVADLRKMGYTGAVLHLDGAGAGLQRIVEQVLGRPTATWPDLLAWDLAQVLPPGRAEVVSAACAETALRSRSRP